MTIHLDLIGIVTSDMARTLAFYRHLGMEFPDGAEDEPHVEYALPGGMRLAFDTEDVVRSFAPDWVPPTGGHRTALAFECDDAAGVDAVCAELVDAGGRVQTAPWDAFWGQRYAVVLDPDGQVIDLFAALEG